MKRLLVSLVLVSLGASFWWVLSRTARFSVKKWDAKFGTVLRHSLDDFGATNADVLSSVNRVQKDASGEWIVHRLQIRLSDPAKRRALEERLRSAGADVMSRNGNDPALIVRRGGRVYQEILFAPR